MSKRLFKLQRGRARDAKYQETVEEPCCLQHRENVEKCPCHCCLCVSYPREIRGYAAYLLDFLAYYLPQQPIKNLQFYEVLEKLCDVKRLDEVCRPWVRLLDDNCMYCRDRYEWDCYFTVELQPFIIKQLYTVCDNVLPKLRRFLDLLWNLPFPVELTELLLSYMDILQLPICRTSTILRGTSPLAATLVVELGL